MQRLQIGPIAIADRPWKEPRTDPGVDPEIFIFLMRENGHIKGGNILLAEVL